MKKTILYIFIGIILILGITGLLKRKKSKYN